MSQSELTNYDNQDPFNHYNTDFIKLDANNWQEETGKCEPPSLGQFVCLKASLEDSFDETTTMANKLQQQQQSSPYVDSINNKSFTDVTFIVGPPQHSKKYVGHRVLLAMTSPVFETMFYGDMADKNKYIRIPDVAPIGFENLLRYAYTDSLNLNSVEDSMLTAYAAKKYLLPQLLKECLTYIELNISPSTACVVFEFAHVLNSQQLILQAMNLIDRQTINVINNKSFNNVQSSTIEFVTNRKYLTLSTEYLLFNSILNWSIAESKRRNLRSDDWSNIRLILKENRILDGIRFLSMTQEEFARVVAKTSSQIDVLVTNNNNNNNLEEQNITSEANTNAFNGQQQEENQTQLSANLNENIYCKKIDVENSNSLLTEVEQRAILLNLALKNIAQLPGTLNSIQQSRQPPPEYFTLKRFKSSGSASSSNLINTTTTTRSIKCISSKFQCLNENVFIVALTIPIRLDISSYANRTPKFECHLKFTTKQAIGGGGGGGDSIAGNAAAVGDSTAPATTTGGGLLLDGSTLLMDTIDESLHISISRDKDCLVRLKRPILIRMGNINELVLTFQTYALDEDVVALRTPKLRSANFSEQTDGENISWLFFKSSNIEFSELHYYY